MQSQRTSSTEAVGATAALKQQRALMQQGASANTADGHSNLDARDHDNAEDSDGNSDAMLEPPPPRVAPRGLAGIFEQYTPDAILDTSALPHNAVLLNIYDVSDSELIQRINRVTTANNNVLVGGVFHGGVQVYSKEWSFGGTEDSNTGISAVWPRAHPQHTYRATVHMGNTQMSSDAVHGLLLKMAPEWPGNGYSLLHRNCISFCNEFLAELGLERVPGWVDRAARAASRVDRMVQLARGLSADEVREQAAAALETLRHESSGAMEAARCSSAQLAEQVQNEVRPQIAQAQARALELGERAQEQAQVLGAALWKWGQELQVSVPNSAKLRQGAVIDPKTIGEKVSDITGRAQEQAQAIGTSLWQRVQDFQKVQTLDIPGFTESASAKKPTRNRRARDGRRIGAACRQPDAGAGDVTKAQRLAPTATVPAPGGDLAGESRPIETHGEHFLNVGLLADFNDEEDGTDPPATHLPPIVPGTNGRGDGPGPLPVVEAPLEWSRPKPFQTLRGESSSSEHTACNGSALPISAKSTSFAGSVKDLLTGDLEDQPDLVPAGSAPETAVFNEGAPLPFAPPAVSTPDATVQAKVDLGTREGAASPTIAIAGGGGAPAMVSAPAPIAVQTLLDLVNVDAPSSVPATAPLEVIDLLA